MKKIIVAVCIILLVSIVSGCKVPEEAPEEDTSAKALPRSSKGEIKLEILGNNKYADIQGINAPTGKAGLINREGTYFIRLTDGFSMPDKGDIYVYVSEKRMLDSAEDIKEDAYEVSVLTDKEGTLEFRMDDSVSADKINSVAFYKKEENMLVAWAMFE